MVGRIHFPAVVRLNSLPTSACKLLPRGHSATRGHPTVLVMCSPPRPLMRHISPTPNPLFLKSPVPFKGSTDQVSFTQNNLPFFFFLILFIYLFIYLWLCWVFVSVQGLSQVAASGGHSSSQCAGLSLSRPLLLRSTGSRRAGSVVVAHGPSCSAACGIFPDPGSNPCPLHWQADSQPLRH